MTRAERAEALFKGYRKMAKMKFTAGPWECVPSTEHHGPYITTEFGNTIADFYTMTNPDMPSTANGGPSKPIHFMHEMADHNARLAAAAPDMYAALQELADARDGDDLLGWVRDTARAAISSAPPNPTREVE